MPLASAGERPIPSRPAERSTAHTSHACVLPCMPPPHLQSEHIFWPRLRGPVEPPRGVVRGVIVHRIQPAARHVRGVGTINRPAACGPGSQGCQTNRNPVASGAPSPKGRAPLTGLRHVSTPGRVSICLTHAGVRLCHDSGVCRRHAPQPAHATAWLKACATAYLRTPTPARARPRVAQR